jgi:hypothetical protein
MEEIGRAEKNNDQIGAVLKKRKKSGDAQTSPLFLF